MVDRVEACIRTIERSEERQDMHAVIHAVEAGAQMSVIELRVPSPRRSAQGMSCTLFFMDLLGSWAGANLRARICLFVVYVFAYHGRIEPVRYYLERDVIQSRSEMRVSNRLDAVFYAA